MTSRSRIGDSLSWLVGFLIAVALTIGFAFGVYHGFTKHGVGTGMLCIVIPPVGIYYAVEAVGWHDDFADVDWDVRLRNDERTLLLLIAQAGGDELFESPDASAKHGATLEEFTSRINEYPAERKVHLHGLANDYLSYTDAVMRDMRAGIRRWTAARSGALRVSPSDELRRIAARIRERYPGTRGVFLDMGGVDQTFSAFNDLVLSKAPVDATPEARSTFARTMELMMSQSRERIAQVVAQVIGVQ